MSRHAPVLDCTAEEKADLIAMSMSRIEEALMVEKSRIILFRLEGEQIQQVAKDQGVSIPTVTKWCKRFSFWGIRGLFDEAHSGKPAKYDAAFRDKLLGGAGRATAVRHVTLEWSRYRREAGIQRLAVWRRLRREIGRAHV